MKKIFLAATTMASIMYARLFGGPIDGTAWDVKVKPDSFFSSAKRDTLIFENGKLTIAGFLNAGFSPASYSAEAAQSGEDTIWNASLKNAEKGILSWSGLVRGDKITGIATWLTKTGAFKSYTFSGSRKSN